MHPVLDVLRARRDRGDRPGDRGDPHRVVLAVEGGGSRATLSAGMTAELAARGYAHAFDAVHGASAGTVNGAWFVAGAADEGAAAWSRPGVMRRVTGVARFLVGRPVVDMAWVVDHLYERVVPLDWDAVRGAATPLHPMATDADTGASVDLRPLVHDTSTLKTALRASTHLPILGGPPVVLSGRRFLDAALAETLPFRTPLAAGASHVLLLRTRRADDPVRPPWRSGDALARLLLARTAPGAAAAWRTRYERQLADGAALTGAFAGRVQTIRPPLRTRDVGQLETDPAVLREAVAAGRAAVHAWCTAARPVA
ncbi:patatin family protein [Actinomycetospora sp. NBRC 106375]|uniref:patatin-like phospholipase family protein n=1 Tax=Actinomycetospora sp. NBRC 106375 TaxID=3032207 RepID=UPI0024A52C2B|nr:patatin-like phospholipase family protein [Actinomycetospora sp. NBRC 106375]GLZ44736.1 patatin family protein [Actinomycetospora sp. NBRC 106375]